MEEKNDWLNLKTILISFSYILYFVCLNHVFLPTYYSVYAYMTGAHFQYNNLKFFLSIFAFIWFVFLYHILCKNKDDILSITLNMFMVICVIPMISVFSYIDYVNFWELIYPFIFWTLLFCFTSKIYSSKRKKVLNINAPKVQSISTIVLSACALLSLICWAWAGFPILTSLSDSTAARLELRANSMPTILSYIFVLLGGVLLPYLFARFLSNRKYVYALISFVLGFLLFSVNGMKTWIFLYLFGFLLILLCKFFAQKKWLIIFSINIGMIALSFLCVIFYVKFQTVNYLSQFGRVVCIPNGIGFRSINFFIKEENPYLYLRESILRHIFDTPYEGGSDFYLDYGANSTINSARSNNGLWGDAFRNFGLFGMVIYPIFFSWTFSIIIKQSKKDKDSLRIFMIFLMIWNSVNTSFFTWLLTGGVIVLIFIDSFFKERSGAPYISNKQQLYR